MKKYILAFLLVSQIPTSVLFAQDDAKKLTMPSSPAFSILNYEPTSVMKPTSEKDLATDVLNSFDKNGKLLMNLGLEVSPYWLQSRPTLTRDQYLNPNLLQTFLQSFNLSAATVKDSATGDNKLGIGFRFKVLNGKPVADLKDAERALNDFGKIQNDVALVKVFSGSTIKTIKDAIDYVESLMTKQAYPTSKINNVISEGEKIARDYKDTKAGIDSFADALNNTIENDKSDPLNKVIALTKQRLGFIVEFAGATAYDVSKGNELERFGIWVNTSNYVSATDLFTLTARYMYHNGDTVLSNFDAGLSYMKKKDQYNVAIEYMMRWYQGQIPDVNISGLPITRAINDFTYRLAVQGSYLLSKQVSVNISFGKNFNQPFVTGSGFFSILGFNYSIFNQQRVKL